MLLLFHPRLKVWKTHTFFYSSCKKYIIIYLYVKNLLVVLSSLPDKMTEDFCFQRRNWIHSRRNRVRREKLTVEQGGQASATTFSAAVREDPEIQHSDLVRNSTGSQHLKHCPLAWWSKETTISAGVSSPGRFCWWEDITQKRDLTPSWSQLTGHLRQQTSAFPMKRRKDIETIYDTCKLPIKHNVGMPVGWRLEINMLLRAVWTSVGHLE